MAESLFIQTVSQGAEGSLAAGSRAGGSLGTETSGILETRDGHPARALTRDYVRRGSAGTTVRNLVGGLLKWVARALYLSPVLAVAYIVTGGETGAIAVATFVIIVAAFFVVLALYVVVSFAVFSGSQRASLARPSLILQAEPATQTDTRDLGQQVTVRGRVVRLRAAAVVISDSWQETERDTYADVFGILRDDGLPVVVLPTTAPTLSAPVGDAAAARVAAERGLFGDACILQEGDQVVLSGLLLDRIVNVNGFELDGEMLRFGGDAHDESLPYRAVSMQEGLLVSDSPDAPLLICLESRPSALPAA
jgi:hypothetical protein